MSTNQNDGGNGNDDEQTFEGDVPSQLVRYTGNGPYRGADGVAVDENDPFYEAENDAEANALVESGRFEFVEDEEQAAARAAINSAGSPATAATTEPFGSQEVQSGTSEAQQMRPGEGPENQPTGPSSNALTSEAMTPGSETAEEEIKARGRAEAEAESEDAEDGHFFEGDATAAYPFIEGTLSDLEAALESGDYDDELDRVEAAERATKGRTGAFDRIEAHREQIDAESADDSDDSDEE